MDWRHQKRQTAGRQKQDANTEKNDRDGSSSSHGGPMSLAPNTRCKLAELTVSSNWKSKSGSAAAKLQVV
jgi:hypothetical protein